MQQTTLRISKTYEVKNPMTYTQWCKKYKVGSRVPKMKKDCDMYTSGDYDFNKLVTMIKTKNKKPSVYDRILKAITA
jgi:hypothetical protein